MPVKTLSPEQTALALPHHALIEALATAAQQYADGGITSPERQVLPLAEPGKFLSMPASAQDIAVHKLISFSPANRSQGKPVIQGIVSVFCATTGDPLLILDGPTVTARRTACISLLALRTLAPAFRRLAIIGTGEQARAHVHALADLYPGLSIDVHGTSLKAAERFCAKQASFDVQLTPRSGGVVDDIQVVISLTSSKAPLYNQPGRKERLLIGVGAFTPEMIEFGRETIESSQLFIDDPVGGPSEAGDLIQANVDWDSVTPLARLLRDGFDRNRPVFFKSVGCAAWDLAAGRCAMANA